MKFIFDDKYASSINQFCCKYANTEHASKLNCFVLNTEEVCAHIKKFLK